MKLVFSEIRDTVDGAVDYLHRLMGGGTAAKVKEAIAWSLPGYFYRPHDADEDTVGTEDCLAVEHGDHREVVATRNAKAWANLISYLSRALDRGETVITSEDGTGRSYISLRPAGTLVVSSDDGGGNTITITADETTGDLTLATSGDVILDTTGVVRIGDPVTPEYAVMFNALKTEIDAYVAMFNAHFHVETGVNTQTAAASGFTQVALTNAPRSAKGRISS